MTGIDDIIRLADFEKKKSSGGTTENKKRNGHRASSKAGGSELLDQVHAMVGKFVAYPSQHAQDAHTLWIAHTHLMDAWESTPRILFCSPEPGSGKTRALEITERLVPSP